MTQKQENILIAALKLFAEEGYTATSTSKVAKEAGVSEGLIFRHFGNKEGLLNALYKKGEEKAELIFADIILESDPKALIKKAFNMPFDAFEREPDFWRLQFKLKWELNAYDDTHWEPIQLALEKAFSKLDYTNPKMEADYIKHFLDGIAGALVRNTPVDKKGMIDFLITKYEL